MKIQSIDELLNKQTVVRKHNTRKAETKVEPSPKKVKKYKKPPSLSLVVITCCALIFLWIAYSLMHDLTGPEFDISPIKNGGVVGQNEEINLVIKDKTGIKSVTVTAVFREKKTLVFQQRYNQPEKIKKIKFSLKDMKIPSEEFSLNFKALDSSNASFFKGNTSETTLRLRLDKELPVIKFKTPEPNIVRGSAALIAYTVSKKCSSTGVFIGDRFFPAYEQKGYYLCLFPFPVVLTPDKFYPKIMAVDIHNNQTVSDLPIQPTDKDYKTDTLFITNSFLRKKSAELAKICPEEKTSLDQYLCANSKERDIDNETILKLADNPENVSPQFLWKGDFKRLPRSAVKAYFGEIRTYVDEHRDKIDEQIHMGVDLASTRNADIPAAQTGRVVWTGYLGIHGNMVIIEHGLGLMTQYSHLSEISVKTGDTVKMGTVIGKTGTSGLAGGDHLHFGVLVGGIPVQPLEWFSTKWVKNNITNRIP